LSSKRSGEAGEHELLEGIESEGIARDGQLCKCTDGCAAASLGQATEDGVVKLLEGGVTHKTPAKADLLEKSIPIMCW
jgi:hypothetical protein